MPIIEFHLLEGRTVDQKRRLCEAVTSTVVDVLGVRREQVRILIHNIPAENFGIAGAIALDINAEANKTAGADGASSTAPGMKGAVA